jgi:16S rRNA (guanine1207-N2)-methyltransferase
MMSHYYDRNPTAGHDRAVIEAAARGITLRFATDAGVFAKHGLDFGSRLLIETMDIPPGARVLDVGCGYGPIGLFAARLRPDAQVTMLDVNERAVDLARENAALNGLGRVEILQSDLYEAVRGRTFDVIVSNPPIRAGKAVVHRIFEEAPAHLNPGGALWIVIRKQQGAPSARAKLETLFASVEQADRSKGYWILKASQARER